jgi:hypothetical protein
LIEQREAYLQAVSMGRAGIEPATLGLKVDVSLFCRLGTCWLNRLA